jgi:hypothetical protein
MGTGSEPPLGQESDQEPLPGEEEAESEEQESGQPAMRPTGSGGSAPPSQ